MNDEVVVKDANGIRSTRKRDRASTVSIVHVDLEPTLVRLFEDVKDSPEYGVREGCTGFKAPSTLGYVPTTKGLFLLDSEGCCPDGSETPLIRDHRIAVPLYEQLDSKMSIVPFASLKVDRTMLLRFPVKGIVNFGKWVRKFGQRLEDNFHNWNDFLTPIYNEEHVKNLIYNPRDVRGKYQQHLLETKMKSNIFTLMAFVGLVGGVTLACSSDDDAGGCNPGEEMCECAASGLCFSGLVCSGGICFPDVGGGTSGTDSGGGANAEDDACTRANECNLLEAGISAADCADENRMCTGDLLSSEYADWQKEVEDCLEFANCKNYQTCITEISACPPIAPPDGGGDTCVADGAPCDYCWTDTCSDAYIGGADGCDCGCLQGPDPDCG